MKKFEWVEHTADIGFKAYGKNLEEAFEHAALALMELITNVEIVEAKEEIFIEVSAEDLEALLFDWLDYFLYLFDAENLVHSVFEIDEILEEDEEVRLEATVWGEEFDRDKHGHGTEVKAITYHMMEIDRLPGQCSVQVVVDI